MDEKENRGSWTSFGVATVLLMLATALLTLFVAHQFYSEQICGAKRLSRPSIHFPKEKTDWQDTERLRIQEKGVSVVRTYGSNRCYILPLKNGEPTSRPFALIPDPLSDDLLEEIAGPDAVRFCAQQDVYLTRDLQQAEQVRESRQKRAAETRASGLDKPYEERTPRCMDLLLDCTSGVGEVQTCYTWVNGVIIMAQTCESATQFKVFMTKPPGRILKIAVEQWEICVERREQGLRC